MVCLFQNVSRQQEKSVSLNTRLHRLEAECGRLQQQVSEAEEVLGQERSRVGQLEGELVSMDMVKDGLSREVEKVCM